MIKRLASESNDCHIGQLFFRSTFLSVRCGVNMQQIQRANCLQLAGWWCFVLLSILFPLRL